MNMNRLIRRGPKIFISYRRDDAKKKADQLRENLERHFGGNSTFMDIEALEGGDRYRREIQKALNSCEVFLAIIGPRWLIITDENNVRRLDKKDDWVRFEIEAALKRDDILVVPILVENATLPRPGELPKSMESLTDEIQAHQLEDASWDSDVTKLIHIIEEKIGRPDPARAGAKWLIAACAVVALGLVGYFVINGTDFFARNDNGIITLASPTATATLSPHTEGNHSSINSANNQPNTPSPTPTSPPSPSPSLSPSPTPDLQNTSWEYAFDGVVQYMIQLRNNGEFYYWRRKNGFTDRSHQFDGTWKLTGPDEIELIFTPTDPSGKEVHTGRIRNNEIHDGTIEDAKGNLLNHSWSAKKT
jgi:hypothetical protein